METYKNNQQALEIAKRLVDYKVTNDLDLIASITNICKEDVVKYIFHKHQNMQNQSKK